MMKRIITYIALCLISFPIFAQEVKFKFQAGSTDASVPTVIMEGNISKLLTELNNADKANRALKLESAIIEPEAKKNLNALWSSMHFTVDDKVVVQRCLNDAMGYQVRDIVVTLHPLDDTFEASRERELVVSLNRSGRISGVCIAISNNQVLEIKRNAVGVTDASRRLEILNFVEHFRSYYTEKNIAALEKIFADDALIITGSVIRQQSMAKMERPETVVKYRREDKSQYLKRLETQIFKNNKYINVEFDKISVVRNGADGKGNFYGVTLHQDWSTIRNGDSKASADHPSYHDEGWLFLLWEFHDDGTPPVIHVRTWQPDEIVKSDSDKIDMNDFVF